MFLKKKIGFRDVLLEIAVIIAVIGVFEIVVWWFDMPKYLLPAPSRVFSVFFLRFSLLMGNAYVTIIEILAGYSLGIVVGIIIAIMLVYSKFLRTTLYPLLVGFQSIPKVAIAPLLVIWFGIGLNSKIVMSMVICFFPIVVNVTAGLGEVEDEYIDLVRSMSGNGWQIFSKIRVPRSLPFFFDALKISLPLAIVGAIIGEFVGASKGLGNLILIAGTAIDTTLVFAALLAITLLSIVLFAVLVLIDKLVVPWRKK